jgi:hypothetical protein
MVLILCIQFGIVLTLVIASRRDLENTLPPLCFFLVLMPLEARVVIPGLFDFNTMRVSLLTLLVLYFCKKSPDSSSALPLKRLMALHVVWVICSTLYSLSVATSTKQLISQVLEYYLLYFLIVKTIRSPQILSRIVFAMMMAISLCCVFGLLEAYARWSILRIFPSNLWITYNGGVDPLYIEWGRGLRIRSTFPHPILFGDALAMGIPLTLYLLSEWALGWRRLLLWTGLVLMFWAIYKTSSRGPWIAVGLCSVLLFLLIKNRMRKYLLTISLGMVIVLVTRPGIRSTIEGMYQATTDPTSPIGSSYLYRDALTAAVRVAVAKDPARTILGYGLGTFRVLGLDVNLLGETHRWFTCDNNWDLFLYETGYIGLAIMCALIIKTLWIAFKGYRLLSRTQSEFSGVIFISLVGFNFLLLSVAGYSWGDVSSDNGPNQSNWIILSLS